MYTLYKSRGEIQLKGDAVEEFIHTCAQVLWEFTKNFHREVSEMAGLEWDLGDEYRRYQKEEKQRDTEKVIQLITSGYRRGLNSIMALDQLKESGITRAELHALIDRESDTNSGLFHLHALGILEETFDETYALENGEECILASNGIDNYVRHYYTLEGKPVYNRASINGDAEVVNGISKAFIENIHRVEMDITRRRIFHHANAVQHAGMLAFAIAQKFKLGPDAAMDFLNRHYLSPYKLQYHTSNVDFSIAETLRQEFLAAVPIHHEFQTIYSLDAFPKKSKLTSLIHSLTAYVSGIWRS